MITADESSNGIGPTFLDMETCETLPPCPTLTSSQAASLARTSPLQARESESREAEADCGVSLTASFAWYDRASSLWRTYQHCLEGGLAEFSETWPRAGMTRDGIASPLPPLVPLTSVTASSLLPTPTATERENDTTATPSQHSLERYKRGEIARIRKTRAPTLTTAVKRWPTPRAREGNVGPLRSKSHYHHLARGYLDAAVQEAEQVIGKLNPTWVEWLMGFPPQWTDLKDSATPSSRKSQSGSEDES